MKLAMYYLCASESHKMYNKLKIYYQVQFFSSLNNNIKFSVNHCIEVFQNTINLIKTRERILKYVVHSFHGKGLVNYENSRVWICKKAIYIVKPEVSYKFSWGIKCKILKEKKILKKKFYKENYWHIYIILKIHMHIRCINLF